MDNRLMRPRATAAAPPPAPTELYFSAVDPDFPYVWDIANWFQNAACTIPATALPTAAVDVVFLTNADNLDSPAIFECRNLTASGVRIANFYEQKLLAAGVVTLSGVELRECYVEAVSIIATDDSSGDSQDYEVRLVADSITLTDFIDDGTCAFVSPDAQFFGSRPIQYVEGNATFNDTVQLGYEVLGTATFNDNAANGGTVNGNATFNDTSLHSGTINGNATFNNNAVSEFGTVNGNAVFNDETYQYGNLNGDAIFNGSSSNTAYISGNAIFNDSSSNGSTGTVAGNATFNNDSNNYGAVGGTITCNTTGQCISS
jgi:hypothetical protein